MWCGVMWLGCGVMWRGVVGGKVMHFLLSRNACLLNIYLKLIHSNQLMSKKLALEGGRKCTEFGWEDGLWSELN